MGSSGRKRERARARETREGWQSSLSPRVSPPRAPVFSCAHCYQAPATQAILVYICRGNVFLHYRNLMHRSNRSFNMLPPGHTPGVWHLCRPGEEGIWLSESSRGWGIWSPCFRGGEFELNPRFHVKSLAWRAIMGDAVLEDFRGKDRAFVANWFRGKGLNKLCAVFEVFKF